ncbi:MAG: ribosome maturation factor [Saprospiraceae bacterium]|nr:ribosome maturation factor [Saprospiraceae bacterium]
MNPEKLIRTWVEARLQEPEWHSYFLLEVVVSGGKKVEVFMDGDSGITLATCRDMSRYLEGLLDEGGQLGEDYTLDVSSPGATRPLRFDRQYAKHVGRTLEVTLKNGDKISGVLKAVHAEDIVLTETLKVKGKKKEIQERSIPLSDIQESNVKLSFK